MNKTVVAAIVAVLVIAGGAGTWYFMNQSKNTTESDISSSKADSSSAVPSTQTASIQEFLDAGQDKKCTYDKDSDSGTMYFADQMLRIDMQRKSGSKTKSGHVIVKESEQYVWYDAEKSGLKFKLPKKSSSVDTTTSGGVSPTAKYDFECSSWSADESMFTPPSDISFTDFSQIKIPATN